MVQQSVNKATQASPGRDCVRLQQASAMAPRVTRAHLLAVLLTRWGPGSASRACRLRSAGSPLGSPRG